MKKLTYFIVKSKPRGITSLLLVIAISLALTTIIAGIAALSIREIKQASNTDLSNRASQVAESAVRVIENTLKSNSDYTYPAAGVTSCDPGNTFNSFSTPNATITCLKVTNQFKNYEASLKKDDATQLFIDDPSANLANLQLSWAKGGTLTQYAYNGSLYPDQNGYNNAAGIEVTLAYWPKTGSYTSASIESRTAFIMPGVTNYGPPGYRLPNPPGATSYVSTCSTPMSQSDYACIVNLSGLLPTSSSSYNYAIRIKPRYAPTSFKLTAQDNSTPANDILVKSNKAQIDVTAKVGDLYRRVKANVVIKPSVIPNLFDSVLYNSVDTDGDIPTKDICKNIKVKRSTVASERVLINYNSENCK